MSVEARALAAHPAAELSPELLQKPLYGVRLEQYAGIKAGLGDAFPLSALLENEAIEPMLFPLAEVAWKKRLATDGPHGPWFTTFCTKLAEAEDWLVREVFPLDDDLDAWMSFLQVFSSHRAPFELLRDLGLRLSDVSRLKRCWERRFAEEPALKKKAEQIANRGVRPLAPLRLGMAELRPFPWTGSGQTSPLPSAKTHAPVHVVPVDRPSERDAANAFEGRARPLEVPSFLKATAPLVDVPKGPPLPFMEGERPQAPSFLKATAPLVDVPKGPLLPFVEASAIATNAARPARPEALSSEAMPGPSPADEPKRISAPSKLVETSPLMAAPKSPALPFTKDEPERTASAAEASTEKTRASRLVETAPSLAAPRGPALPFLAPPDPEEPLAKGKRNPLAELSLAFKVPEHLPPAKQTPSAQAPSAQAPSAPKTPSAQAPSAGAYAPRLTLEQYASLCVELSVTPDRGVETLSRYRMTLADKGLIDAYYRESFARNEGLRARYDHACATYRAWYIEHLRHKG